MEHDGKHSAVVLFADVQTILLDVFKKASKQTSIAGVRPAHMMSDNHHTNGFIPHTICTYCSGFLTKVASNKFTAHLNLLTQ